MDNRLLVSKTLHKIFLDFHFSTKDIGTRTKAHGQRTRTEEPILHLPYVFDPIAV